MIGIDNANNPDISAQQNASNMLYEKYGAGNWEKGTERSLIK